MNQLTSCTDNDCDNQTIDTQDTSHNNGDDGLHDELRAHDTHGGNSNTTLCCAISRSEAYRKGTRNGERTEGNEEQSRA